MLYWYKSTNTDAKGAADVKSEEGHLKRDLNLNSNIAGDPSQVLNTDLNTDLNSDLTRDLKRDLDRDLNSDLTSDLKSDVRREEAARHRGEEASHLLSTVRHALRQFVCDIEGVQHLQHEVFEGVVAGFEAQLEEAKADVQRERERARKTESESEREREREKAEAGALQRAADAVVDEARDVEPASEEAAASRGYALEVRQCVYFCTSKARRLQNSEGEPAGYASEVRHFVYFCTRKAIGGASVCEGEPRHPRDTH